MGKRSICLYVVAAVAIVLSRDATAAATRLSPSFEDNRTANHPLEDTQRWFIESVHTALAERRFADLDKMADELGRTKARFPGGDWKLYRFYGAVGRPGGGAGDLSDRSIELLVRANGLRVPGSLDVQSDEMWDRHIALVRAWRTERPRSAAAAIALGDALVGYAWKARGAGYSATVAEEGNRVFKERLGQAAAVLGESKRIPTANVHWYCVMIDLARGQGWNRREMDALLEKAVAVEPLYLHMYSGVARYLTPRWYGDTGDWERFAEETAQRIGGREGSVIYGHIAWQMSSLYGAREFFVQNHVSWARVKQGFVDRESIYGPSVQSLNAFCLLAGSVRDKTTTRELFERIGEAWDAEVWTERRYFDSYRAWAFKN